MNTLTRGFIAKEALLRARHLYPSVSMVRVLFDDGVYESASFGPLWDSLTIRLPVTLLSLPIDDMVPELEQAFALAYPRLPASFVYRRHSKQLRRAEGRL